MKILIDENVPQITVDELRALSHDVREVRGTRDEGSSEDHSGILVVRLRQPNRLKIHQRVLQALAQFEPKDWPGTTVVIRDAVQSVWHASKSL